MRATSGHFHWAVIVMWLICIACHHAVEGREIPRKGILVCTGCGSTVARAVKKPRTYMFNGGQMAKDMARKMMHAGLVSIAKENGYKPGWIKMKYLTIFREWPPRQIPDPADPNSETLWWIRKTNMQYAKKNFPRKSKAKPLEEQSA